MVDQLSPLQPVYQPGSHGNFVDGVGVTLTETQPGSIVQIAAWPGQERAVLDGLQAVTGLLVPEGAGAGIATDAKAAFGIAPGRYLVVDEEEGLSAKLSAAILNDAGSVTDLSHGRTAIRVGGPKAEWVLAQLFAIDFAPRAFPAGAGRATVHHDFLVQVQRTAETQFDLYVFRSFARSFWKALCHASGEVGYEVR